VWQRGTTFTSPANGAYTADRFKYAKDGTGTETVSQQAFTAGTAPVSGYESQYFLRCASTAAGTSTFMQMSQPIEDVRTFAGQTVTLSFWAKSDTARSSFIYAEQNFGSGGSATVQYLSMGSASTTTSWQRFTFAVALTSISGKTVGTSSYLEFFIRLGAVASGATLDIWGVQVEIGASATSFQTASGTIGGELALCQRYYYRATAANNYAYMNALAGSSTTTAAIGNLTIPVTMRTNPSSVDYSTIRLQSANDAANAAITVLTINTNVNNNVSPGFDITVASGLTANVYYRISANGSTSAYLGFSAEL
jgi:hypothetical protein